MPRPAVIPPLLDYMPRLAIGSLYRIGAFKVWVKFAEGSFSIRPENSFDIPVSFAIHRAGQDHFIVLMYEYHGRICDISIRLSCRPSNLGKGVNWYFVCPHTGRSCRVLYFFNGSFRHRLGINGAMYHEQTMSKKDRDLSKLITRDHYAACARYEVKAKNFVPMYKGKMTRRYARLYRKIMQGPQIDTGSLLIR